MLGYMLSFRFIFWLLVGGGVTWFLLDRKGRDPWVGAIICGVLGGFGGIFLLGWIWLWMWYVMPSGVGRVYKVYNSRKWKIRW